MFEWLGLHKNRAMSLTLSGISSMATRLLLNELALAYQARSGVTVAFESVGGVDAAKRVAAGESFDVVVLAADAITKLAAHSAVLAETATPLVNSAVAIAVRTGTAAPDITSEDALRHAVLAARSVGYSTGPSGGALLALFARWGIADHLRERLVQAPPGVPVGALVARGEVELAFQQLSELMHLEGVTVIGAMPAPIEIVTTFSAAVCRISGQPSEAHKLLAYLASPATASVKLRHGMQATTPGASQ